MKYLQSSTEKSGFQKANNLAFCRLNALSSAKGTGIRTANSFAVLRLNALSSAKGIKAPKRVGFLLYGILAEYCSAGRRTGAFPCEVVQ